MQNIPKEDYEAEVLANYLRANWYTFTHIWNESGQRGTKNIVQMMKKKQKLWVSKWFPDYCIILKNKALLFIELKRQKRVLKNWNLGKSPSNISIEQKEWISSLNEINNVQAEICYWAEEAIRLIEYLEDYLSWN